MYVPSHFSVDDEQLRALLGEVRAGDLVTVSGSGLVATFIPLLVDLDEAGHLRALRGHLARPNRQAQEQPVGEALVIVSGGDAYVSPGWYPSKQEHGRVVPTWDYVALHVHGHLVLHDDPEWVARVVEDLTRREEARQARPWSVADAPPAYVAGQLRAIVGVELLVTRVEAKAKLSQNRPEADIDGVVTGLRGSGDGELAQLVERFRR